MFKIGDKVKLIKHPYTPIGQIINVEYDFYNPSEKTYTVKFDDPDILPRELSGYTRDCLILILAEGQKQICTCDLISIMTHGCKCGGI